MRRRGQSETTTLGRTAEREGGGGGVLISWLVISYSSVCGLDDAVKDRVITPSTIGLRIHKLNVARLKLIDEHAGAIQRV